MFLTRYAEAVWVFMLNLLYERRETLKGIWGFVMFSVQPSGSPHGSVCFTWMYSYLTSAPFGLSYDVNAFFVLTKNISECRPVPWWPPGFHSGSSSLEHWRWSPRSCHGPSCSPAGTNMSVRLGHLWSTGALLSWTSRTPWAQEQVSFLCFWRFTAAVVKCFWVRISQSLTDQSAQSSRDILLWRTK